MTKGRLALMAFAAYLCGAMIYTVFIKDDGLEPPVCSDDMTPAQCGDRILQGFDANDPPADIEEWASEFSGWDGPRMTIARSSDDLDECLSQSPNGGYCRPSLSAGLLGIDEALSVLPCVRIPGSFGDLLSMASDSRQVVDAVTGDSPVDVATNIVIKGLEKKVCEALADNDRRRWRHDAGRTPSDGGLDDVAFVDQIDELGRTDPDFQLRWKAYIEASIDAVKAIPTNICRIRWFRVPC